jgi:hypothetical protein
MDMSLILAWVNSIHPIAHLVLVILGSLVVLATIYVKLTPSVDDDAMLAKIEAMPVIGSLLNGLMAFSVIQRKD